MKLKVTEDKSKHSEICVAVSWSSASELFSCSDDQNIVKWQIGQGAEKGSVGAETVAQMDKKGAYVTDMHWFPTKKGGGGGADVFVTCATDGCLRLMSKGGRVEKVVEGHQGAVVSVRWNSDGTALATCGEDGVIKVWSRAGMLRSTLVQSDCAVYSICWGQNSDSLLYTNGKHLVIKPVSRPSEKHTKWKAHDAAVLKVDWNAVNDLIVSGGEDGRYKVWDSYGRQLYASAPHEHAITAVAWSPAGETFAVGTFNQIQVCDQNGWAQCQANTTSGSVVNVSWTADGTHLAGAGGNGTVCFGQLTDRRLEWGKLEVVVTGADTVETVDLDRKDGQIEPLELRDRIANVSVGFNHLVVATLSQVCVYQRTEQNEWSTPHIVDLKDTPTLLLQCERYFLVVDNFSGVQIFNYEGRAISAPKFAGLRTEVLNERCVALSNDQLAIIDRADPKIVRIVDVPSVSRPHTCLQ
jgi:intraflagellar transport protein 80